MCLTTNITAGLLWRGGTPQLGDSSEALCQTQKSQTAVQRSQVEQQETWSSQESRPVNRKEEQEESECFGSAAC